MYTYTGIPTRYSTSKYLFFMRHYQIIDNQYAITV